VFEVKNRLVVEDSLSVVQGKYCVNALSGRFLRVFHIILGFMSLGRHGDNGGDKYIGDGMHVGVLGGAVVCSMVGTRVKAFVDSR
jgi:hypothetical protein